MQIIVAENAAAFLALAQDWLMRAEFENTMLLGVARGLEAGIAVNLTAPPFLAVALHDDGAIAGAAVRTPPGKLLVSQLAPGAIAPMARAAHGVMPDLRTLNGPEPTASAFAEAWCRFAGGTSEIGMRQRCYVLHAVADQLPPVPGALRRARENERDLALTWAHAFRDEAAPGGGVELHAWVERAYRLQRAFVWDDGGPVTMVAAGGSTDHAATISFVYTPPAQRRRGYATAAVAALSRRLLHGKQYCCLYTDRANPTSNSIYQAIGYRAVCDMNDHHLAPRRAA